MSIASRPLRLWSLVVCLFASLSASSAHAQVTSGNPALQKQLSRLDLGISAMGTITKGVSGTNYLDVDMKQDASKTVGVLVTVRYTVSPYLGGEFNYSYARFTQHYRNAADGTDAYVLGGVQANTSEYSFGYVAHPPHPILGAQPFLSAGVGTTAFRPTPGGGQSLYSRARMTYYYSAGLEKSFNEHFGVRAAFRQTFYKAPDFGVNYLELQKQTWTVEPTVGFVIHF